MVYHNPLQELMARRLLEKHLEIFLKHLNIKLVYGTPYIHTPTGLVDRGIKTLNDYIACKSMGRLHN